MQISTRLCSALLAGLMASSALAADGVDARWAKAFDGKTTAGDNGTEIAIDANGNALFLNTLGSKEGATDIYFGGQLLFEGSPYTGTSNDNNFDLTKVDAAGNPLWTIYTKSGDCASSQGGVAIAADGGVVFVAKVRQTDGKTEPVTFVDATGATFDITFNSEKRYYCLVIGKANADGKITWIKKIDVEHGKAPAADNDFTAEAIYCRGVAVAQDGNIFIGGNFRMPVLFEGNKVTPRNTAAWDGNSQTATGDLFIARYSADGTCTDVLVPRGNAMQTEQILGLEADGDNIYFQGFATPAADGEKSFTLGGKQLLLGETASPFVGVLNSADMAVDWVSVMQGYQLAGAAAYQNSSLTVGRDALWLTAQCNGEFRSEGNTALAVATTQGKLREGVLMKFKKTDGTFVAGVNSREGFDGMAATALTGYMGTIENDGNRVMVYGYGMNAQVGCYLRTYNAETLQPEPENTYNILKSTAAGMSALNIAYNAESNTAYVTARSNKGVTAAGLDETAVPSGWAVFAANFNVPEEAFTALAEVTAEAREANVSIAQGSVTVVAGTQAATVADVLGRVHALVEANTEATIKLANGIYIIGGKKYIVK